MVGCAAYVNDMRSWFGTRWGYCAFFTKYPVGHFAYASLGGPRLVMHYGNDGWGPDNIDRVFTHETGHMLSIAHCIAYECNMCGCNNREEADRRPLACCPECVAKICDATEAEPVARYRALADWSREHRLSGPERDYRRFLDVLAPR